MDKKAIILTLFIVGVSLVFFILFIVNENIDRRPAYTRSTAQSIVSVCKKFAVENNLFKKKVSFCRIKGNLTNYQYYWRGENFIFIVSYEDELYLYDSEKDMTVNLKPNQ